VRVFGVLTNLTKTLCVRALAQKSGWIIEEVRGERLRVPLVVGAFTHVAVQVYLERVTHHQFVGTFFNFLPQYFTSL